MKYSSCIILAFLTLGSLLAGDQVEFKTLEEARKIEVLVNGELFTTYCYGPEFPDKPVFYPVKSLGGKMVNRGYPMLPATPGGSSDHPHHQSLSFTYGDVNGLDFWTKSPKAEIIHKEVARMQAGDPGILEVLLEWKTGEGEVLLTETKTVTFGGGDGYRWMDHDMTLRATNKPVVFGDTKEGAFAIRVADSLREKGGSGHYINAYGQAMAKEIWGKRAPWVALLGNLDGEDITIAMFDHPSAETYPSYWHARDYGLFSANPLGRRDFIGVEEPLTRTLQAGDSFRFRYRVVIYRGKQSKQRLDDDYQDYIR